MVKLLFSPVCLFAISVNGHHEFFMEGKHLKEMENAIVMVSHDRFYDQFVWSMMWWDPTSTDDPPITVLMVV